MTPAFVIRESRNKTVLAQFFRANPSLYAYLIGDLDPFFFDNTQWWVAQRSNASSDIIDAALLSYNAFSTPVLLGLAENDAQGALWRYVLDRGIAEQAHVHYRRRHTEILAEAGALKPFGSHYKMLWRSERQQSDVKNIDVSEVVTLTPDDISNIRTLHQLASPGAYFDERLLETGLCFGVKHGETLVAFAGCHVYSIEYSVAALGAIATHPRFRRQGLGAKVTLRLLEALREHIDCICLNVHSENTPALRIYERLGFTIECEYEEALLSAD